MAADDRESRMKLRRPHDPSTAVAREDELRRVDGHGDLPLEKHPGLKRNFQVMPGAEWLELLCKHIPDRYEHLVQ